jgi:hypothetical protein
VNELIDMVPAWYAWAGFIYAQIMCAIAAAAEVPAWRGVPSAVLAGLLWPSHALGLTIAMVAA